MSKTASLQGAKALTKGKVETIGDAFRELRNDVRRRKCFERAPAVYFVLTILWGVTFIASYFLSLASSSLVTVTASVMLASVCAVQLAYIAHDAGHGHVSRHRFVNKLVGQLALTVTSGYAFSSWTHTHDQHHRRPNVVDLDPDVDTVWVALHDWARPQTRAQKLTRRVQHWILLPYYTVHLFELRLRGLKDVLALRLRADALGLVLHCVGLLVLPALVFPVDRVLGCYVALSAGSGVYYGLIFAVNHIGATYVRADEQVDFVRLQVRSSRNVLTGRFGDFVMGGLNLQIEHHLVPGLPRFQLRRASETIREFCAHQALHYEAVHFSEALVAVFRHLQRLSRGGRQAGDPEARPHGQIGCAAKETVVVDLPGATAAGVAKEHVTRSNVDF